MKVLISNIVWGQQYAALFARYSVASLLARENLPRLQQDHAITFQLVTTRHDRSFLLADPAIAEVARYGTIEWEIMEDFGIGRPTTGGGKYHLLSALQNIAIGRAAIDHDAIVFNYADFIWSNGSLPAAIGLLSKGDERIDAALGFCMPVDRDAAIPEIDRFRKDGVVGVVELTPREGALIAVEKMHREAKIRFWDDRDFTAFPTYLIWPVDPHGVLVRAYHQSILALRVRPDDPILARGIVQGTLDGSFTAQLAEDKSRRFAFATDSDKLQVFSLYHTALDSRLPHGQTRESSLAKVLNQHIAPEQRSFADHAIYLRTRAGGEALWEATSSKSQKLLDRIEAATPCDEEAYARIRRKEGSVRRYRKLAFPHRNVMWRLDLMYKLLIIGPAGALFRGARRLKRIFIPQRSPSLPLPAVPLPKRQGLAP